MTSSLIDFDPRLPKELFSSLRETNKRIKELYWVIKEKIYKEDSKKKILDRIEKLTETKFCIIYSIYDIRNKIINDLTKEAPMEKIEEIEKAFNLKEFYSKLKSL